MSIGCTGCCTYAFLRLCGVRACFAGLVCASLWWASLSESTRSQILDRTAAPSPLSRSPLLVTASHDPPRGKLTVAHYWCTINSYHHSQTTTSSRQPSRRSSQSACTPPQSMRAPLTPHQALLPRRPVRRLRWRALQALHARAQDRPRALHEHPLLGRARRVRRRCCPPPRIWCQSPRAARARVQRLARPRSRAVPT